MLGIGALATIAVLFRGLVATVLDEEGSRVAGVPVTRLNVVVAVLAALTVAVSMRIVGILLIAALMVLPVIAANRVAWSLRSTFALSMAFGLGSVDLRALHRVLRRHAARAARSSSSPRARSRSAPRAAPFARRVTGLMG